MTTIIVLPRTKEIYADGRVTISDSQGNIDYPEENFPKVFKHPSGKLIASGAGDTTIINQYLLDLGFEENPCYELAFGSSKSNTTSDIIILNNYTNNLYLVKIKTNKKGKITSLNKSYFKGCDRAILGSGCNKAVKVYDKTDDPVLAIKVASFTDKFTNSNIQRVSL